MPNSYSRDGSFNPNLTTIKDSYNLYNGGARPLGRDTSCSEDQYIMETSPCENDLYSPALYIVKAGLVTIVRNQFNACNCEFQQ